MFAVRQAKDDVYKHQPGPAKFDDLFKWPEYNALQLLQNISEADSTQVQKNLIALAKFRLNVHEAYSGMGTAATMLHVQYKALYSA